MCIPLLSHGKRTRPSKFCDKYLGILVATIGLGSGKKSVTNNIMLQPPISELLFICLETMDQREMEYCPNYPLSCALQCATFRF